MSRLTSCQEGESGHWPTINRLHILANDICQKTVSIDRIRGWLIADIVQVGGDEIIMEGCESRVPGAEMTAISSIAIVLWYVLVWEQDNGIAWSGCDMA
jgi:hypothetical protein